MLSNWFGETRKTISTAVSNQPDSTDLSRAEKIKLAKQKQVDRQANRHILQVSSLGDVSEYEVIIQGAMSGWFTKSRPVLLHKKWNIDHLTTHLSTVSDVDINFKGHFAQIRNLLEKIPVEWFGRQNSVIIEVTDGLRMWGTKDRTRWMRLVLDITQVFRTSVFTKGNEDLLDDDKLFDVRMGTELNSLGIVVELEGHCAREFIVKCESMDIPLYDVVHEYLFFDTGKEKKLVNPLMWKLAKKIIPAEAEFFTEEENKFEFMHDGKKMIVTFFP